MPTICTVHRVALMLVATLGLLVPGADAQPVTPAELRREIEKLQAENLSLANQVQILTEELAGARARHEADARRVAELEAEVRQLRESGASAPPGGTSESTVKPEVPTRAPIPADPFASPASLLGELQRRYAASFPAAGGGEATPAVEAFTAARRKSLEQWAAVQARELEGAIEWRVRLTGLRTLDRSGHAVTLAVLDPASGLPIGDSLEVAVPRDMVDRVARELGPTGGDEKAPTWTLVGTISARPRVNGDRPVPGVFNHPAFVGAYVEFGFDLDWSSIAVVTRSP